MPAPTFVLPTTEATPNKTATLEDLADGINAPLESLYDDILDVESRVSTVEGLAISGAVRKAAVACATTANITLSGEQTIDGVTTSASRVLVKNQSTAAQNGIYVSAAGAWARAADMNAADEVQGAAVYVTGGAVGAGKTFYTGSAVTTLGTDAIAWVMSEDQSAIQAEFDALEDPAEKNRIGTAHERYIQKISSVSNDKPRAAVVILLGQSTNQARAADTNLISKMNLKAKMFAGGVSSSTFDFWDFSNDGTSNWTDMATVEDYAETIGNIPGVGISATLTGGKFQRAYICSVAVGARSLLQLASGGPVATAYAAAHRFCDIARAAGYAPEVMFYAAHGEQDSAIATGEANYYDYGMSYYGRCQLMAAQAMRQPNYIAPVFLTYPAKQFDTDADRAVKEAIRQIAADLPSAVDCGGLWPFPLRTDRVHPGSLGNILRGEYVGKAMRGYYENGLRNATVQVVDVAWNGATEAVVTFSEPVVRDATLGIGTGLNAANAVDGIEWLDNGAYVAISAIAYSGWKATITLAATPAGTTAQQELRIAVQDVPDVSDADPANHPGCSIRAADGGFASIYSATYTHQRWAAPQTFTDVRDA